LEEVIKEMYEDYSPAFLIVGYGVMRRFDDTINYNFKEQARNRRLRYSRVASLFEGNYGLIPLNSWLPEMQLSNNGRYTQIVHLIDRLTPDDVKFEGEFVNEEFYCDFRGARIPFGAMSDGYRNYLGWIGDLLYHVCIGAPSGKKLVECQGVVLVDEIDLLLHPEWQRTVIQSLSENFPNMQFVFTTHSPIVASSVEKENVFVMETDTDGSAIVKQYNEYIYGLTAEQVLLSSYFGLETTRPESVVKERYEPISDKAIEGSHEDALEFLRRLNTPPEADKADKSEFDAS
jgi:predicted ATP-binding protein involved in virulence